MAHAWVCGDHTAPARSLRPSNFGGPIGYCKVSDYLALHRRNVGREGRGRSLMSIPYPTWVATRAMQMRVRVSNKKKVERVREKHVYKLPPDL